MRKNIKQEFQLGDTAYMVDEDYRWHESEIHRVELCKDGTIEYSTYDCDFTTEDINNWVFKSEIDREVYQLLK